MSMTTELKIDRYKLIAIILLNIFLFYTIYPSFSQAEYTPKNLSIIAYGDGSTFVKYTVVVDPILITVNVNLFGEVFQNLIVVNEEGEPLDFSINGSNITIDTIGSFRITIMYVTYDLINKSGRLWTFAINSPVNFTVTLPANATIMGLTSTPLQIRLIEGRYIIKMPLGYQEIDYIIGIIGSKEAAEMRISGAETAIQEAKSKGLEVKDAEQKLSDAKEAFNKGKYADAELLAMQAEMLAIQKAREIETKEEPIPVPELLLNRYVLIIATILLGTLATIVTILIKKRPVKTYQKELKSIDVKKILSLKPGLRPEDRELIEFLGESGGECFESEVRDRFKLPRTTVWRMVKRLEKEGIVEVTKVGGQNLIRVSKKYVRPQ